MVNLNAEIRRYVAIRWNSNQNKYSTLYLYAYSVEDAESQATASVVDHKIVDGVYRVVRPAGNSFQIEPYIEEKHGPWHGWQPGQGVDR